MWFHCFRPQSGGSDSGFLLMSFETLIGVRRRWLEVAGGVVSYTLKLLADRLWKTFAMFRLDDAARRAVRNCWGRVINHSRLWSIGHGGWTARRRCRLWQIACGGFMLNRQLPRSANVSMSLLSALIGIRHFLSSYAFIKSQAKNHSHIELNHS